MYVHRQATCLLLTLYKIKQTHAKTQYFFSIVSVHHLFTKCMNNIVVYVCGIRLSLWGSVMVR